MHVTLEELEYLISKDCDVQINTCSGYEKITDTYRKYGPGKKIIFDDDTEIVAANDHLILDDLNTWISWKNLSVGDKVSNKIINNIVNTDEQEWIDFTIDASHSSYLHKGITHHNSGKSFMIYIISQWYDLEKKLIIVPTVGLVSQFESDLRDYGFKGKIVTSLNGLSRSNNIDADIIVSTWQSLDNGKTKMPNEWYEQFGVVFGDECIHPDSLISTDKGLIKIKDLKAGDLVKTINETNMNEEMKPIVKVHHNISVNEKKYKIVCDNKNIIVTGNHKIFTKRGWIRADRLEKDDVIKCL